MITLTKEQDMIHQIRHFVAEHGELVNKAQSCWGMDRWEHNGVGVGLGDDGFTDFVFWGDRLSCSHTYNRDVVYSKGNAEELTTLFEGLIK